METAAPQVSPAHPPQVEQHGIFGLFRRMAGNYTFRVVLQGVLTLWAVTTFTFILIRQMPGNPVQIKIDQLMDQRQMSLDEARRSAAGLFDFDPDEPLIQQYVRYLGKLVQGDLGSSILSAGTPVTAQIKRYLPWTLFSVGSGLLISFTLGVLLGMAMAYWRGGILDNVMTALASIMYGVPDFVIALLLLLVAGVQLKWFEIGDVLGGVSQDVDAGFNLSYIANLIQHAALPVLTYVWTTVGGWILTMKSSTISTLGEDYITVAKARGLPERRILTAYVGRNAMLPLVTRLAISIGFVVGGSVIIETIFQYPGLGRLLYTSISSRDYTTMQGVFLVIAAAVVFSNILADLLFGVLDPRVRIGGQK
ncbi:ABC transporter permease [Aggregatilinea lenta]|uniref:ABC transporter permease n=1 Tax=Aggregatilinea lenta TaxID=913108 RepID=UPI000E5C0F32|nr:ABC transporter permease [Aggregatilinea lenta]